MKVPPEVKEHLLLRANYTDTQAVRTLGKWARIFIWFKAMAISGIVWSIAFCFVLVGLALPWKGANFLNWMLILMGLVIGYAAFWFDRLVWRAMRKKSPLRTSVDPAPEVDVLEHDVEDAEVVQEAKVKSDQPYYYYGPPPT